MRPSAAHLTWAAVLGPVTIAVLLIAYATGSTWALFVAAGTFLGSVTEGAAGVHAMASNVDKHLTKEV